MTMQAGMTNQAIFQEQALRHLQGASSSAFTAVTATLPGLQLAVENASYTVNGLSDIYAKVRGGTWNFGGAFPLDKIANALRIAKAAQAQAVGLLQAAKGLQNLTGQLAG